MNWEVDQRERGTSSLSTEESLSDFDDGYDQGSFLYDNDENKPPSHGIKWSPIKHTKEDNENFLMEEASPAPDSLFSKENMDRFNDDPASVPILYAKEYNRKNRRHGDVIIYENRGSPEGNSSREEEEEEVNLYNPFLRSGKGSNTLPPSWDTSHGSKSFEVNPGLLKDIPSSPYAEPVKVMDVDEDIIPDIMERELLSPISFLRSEVLQRRDNVVYNKTFKCISMERLADVVGLLFNVRHPSELRLPRGVHKIIESLDSEIDKTVHVINERLVNSYSDPNIGPLDRMTFSKDAIICSPSGYEATVVGSTRRVMMGKPLSSESIDTRIDEYIMETMEFINVLNGQNERGFTILVHLPFSAASADPRMSQQNPNINLRVGQVDFVGVTANTNMRDYSVRMDNLARLISMIYYIIWLDVLCIIRVGEHRKMGLSDVRSLDRTQIDPQSRNIETRKDVLFSDRIGKSEYLYHLTKQNPDAELIKNKEIIYSSDIFFGRDIVRAAISDMMIELYMEARDKILHEKRERLLEIQGGMEAEEDETDADYLNGYHDYSTENWLGMPQLIGFVRGVVGDGIRFNIIDKDRLEEDKTRSAVEVINNSYRSSMGMNFERRATIEIAKALATLGGIVGIRAHTTLFQEGNEQKSEMDRARLKYIDEQNDLKAYYIYKSNQAIIKHFIKIMKSRMRIKKLSIGDIGDKMSSVIVKKTLETMNKGNIINYESMLTRQEWELIIYPFEDVFRGHKSLAGISRGNVVKLIRDRFKCSYLLASLFIRIDEAYSWTQMRMMKPLERSMILVNYISGRASPDKMVSVEPEMAYVNMIRISVLEYVWDTCYEAYGNDMRQLILDYLTPVANESHESESFLVRAKRVDTKKLPMYKVTHNGKHTKNVMRSDNIGKEEIEILKTTASRIITYLWDHPIGFSCLVALILRYEEYETEALYDDSHLNEYATQMKFLQHLEDAVIVYRKGEIEYTDHMKEIGFDFINFREYHFEVTDERIEYIHEILMHLIHILKNNIYSQAETTLKAENKNPLNSFHARYLVNGQENFTTF